MDTWYVEKVLRRWRNIVKQHKRPEVFLDFDLVYIDEESLAIIDAMVMQWPRSAEAINWPAPDDPDTRWPGMERGILFVFPEPKMIGHLVTSVDIPPNWDQMTAQEKLDHVNDNPFAKYDLPPEEVREEFDSVVAVLIGPPIDMAEAAVRNPNTNETIGKVGDLDMHVSYVMWLHERDIVTDGFIPWGDKIVQNDLVGYMAHAARFERALVEYVGTPTMAVMAEPRLPTRNRKQLARAHSNVRVLSLRRTEASVPEDGAPRTVEWTKRWIVRGHWRNQAYGPGLTLRKLKYIFPFVKGPDDKPLDVRPTVFGIEEPG